jgi:hypothetical protein
MSAEPKVRGDNRPVWREMFPGLLAAEEQRGVEKGIERGIEIGRVVEARRVVVLVLEARGFAVGEDERARIEGCEDLTTLRAWHRRAAVAPDLVGVFGAPTVAHDAIVALFRQRPLLAVELLRDAAGVLLPQLSHATLATEAHAQLARRRLSPDLVVRLEDPERSAQPVLAIAVEVQMTIDPEKTGAWPAYVTGVHRTLGCPVRLLVVAMDERVARWAATPIAVGPPGFVLTPEVAGPAGVARILEAAVAERSPHFAVLAAVAGGV